MTEQSPKAPPYSLEAEQAVLGGLMLDNQAWDQVSNELQAQDFYQVAHQLIFSTLGQLAQQLKPFDVVTVLEQLKSKQALDKIGGEVFLFELANNTPSVANIKAYVDIVREKSVLRQLIQVAQRIADQAFTPEGRSIGELLDEAESEVFAIAEQTGKSGQFFDIKQLLTKAVERIDKLYHSNDPITGLATGFSDFDQLTSGLQESDLVIVAGRPSMGKTAFAVNIAEYATIKKQQPILIFSMEMPGDALAMRLISSLGRIDQQNLRTGKLSDQDWPRITSAIHTLAEAKLFIDDTPSLSPGEVRARARRMAREHGQIGLIVIDYLQLMRVPGFRIENRTAEISEISRSLKALAKELNTPVIALSQLNRSLEQRSDKRPVMSDLRESGAIEQDADLIVFIYRDEVYNEDSPDKGIAEIIIAKQRNGPIGKVRLAFLGRYTKFEGLANDTYQQVA
ncbi:MAG: replicative DNA helicase [Legionellales bacterium]|nr:replicative DNA helicase [Legionellales bacterium]